MEPVVRGVNGDKVGRRALIDQEPVDPEHQVKGTASNQEILRLRYGPSHEQAGRSEEQMNNVVQDGYLENSQEHRL